MTPRRTYRRTRPSTFFRGPELMRLFTGLVMLAVVFMLMNRARDPHTWSWIAKSGTEFDQEPNPTVPPAAPNAEVESAQAKSPNQSDPVEVSGPTDEDAEERDAALEEFQAITDRTTNMQPEEMASYWRLLRWIENQPLSILQRRCRKDVVFDDFMQTPDEYRGTLVRLDLNVRIVRPHDAPQNSAGLEKVYEIWGWTTESKAWLYVGLTAQLPPDMPIGSDVHEKVTFYGYFYKLLGYHEAGAKPRDKPLAAPLLIGRVSWRATPAPPQEPDTLFWITVIGGAVMLILIATSAAHIFKISRSSGSHTLRPRSSITGDAVDEWLDQVGGPETPHADPASIDFRAEAKDPSRANNNGTG